jgi:hypothetical protein
MSELVDGFIDFSITFFFFAAIFFALDYIVLKRFIFKSLLNFYNSRRKRERWGILILIAVIYLIFFGGNYYVKYTFRQQVKASQTGFFSVEEMKEINRKGFNTKVEWLESEAKHLGFQDVDEMNRLVKQGFSDKSKYDLLLKQFDSEGDFKDALSKGFKSRVEYDNYWEGEKNKGEFSSIAELKDALSRGVTNKTDYKDALAKERLLAEKKAKEDKEQAYLQWQNNSLNIIKDYHNKTKLINNTSAFGPGRNLSRSEQQEYDAMVSNAKKTMTEIIGKEIRNIQCWYLGLQAEADEELWCYSRKFTPDLLYKVKISTADAKKLGSHYKDDEFLFTGDVYKLDLTGVTIGRGGRAEEQPVVIMVKSKIIRRVR